MSKELEANVAGESIPFYRKRWFIVLAGLAAAGLASAGISTYLKLRGTLYTDNAIVDGPKISVSSQCAGRIVRMAVTEGLEVKKGELLLELDASEANADTAKAAALRAAPPR